MDEFIEQFIIESRELVEQATTALERLAVAPRDAQALDALFRAFHTLKGGAGIIEFTAMERLLHVAEELLSRLRTDAAALSPAHSADCYASLDLVTRWLDAMEQSGSVPADAEAQAGALLQQPASVPEEAEAPTHTEAARALLEAQVDLLDAMPPASFAGSVAAAGAVARNALAVQGHAALAAELARATALSLAERNARHLRQALVAALAATGDAGPEAPAAAPVRADGTARTLRVDAARVELLVRLTGELTVVRNALGHTASEAQAAANPLAATLKEQHALLDRLTAEVQDAVLGIRVLPLRTVFGRFPAMVREMSATLGKPVRLLVEGEATEADKAIVEVLFEPLLHVVRNALDHGIELPAVRARSGKPPVATLVMRATREGDRVLVEVADDGAGIDVERVRVVALERGIVTPDEAAGMTDAELAELVFAPGFSTAAAVTQLSGRGVGMDAVRTAVGRIGGTVTLHSRAGAGTTLRFSLPYSVMMTQVMTVEAGGQSFGIPLEAVVETIRVPASDLAGIGAAQALVHRERTLPVFDLATLLQVGTRAAADTDAIIVVTALAGQWGGIRVDRAGTRMEVMLKPLDGLLAGIPGITGTTIMGDGRVLLVLDPVALLL